jgi:hypothetical protein
LDDKFSTLNKQGELMKKLLTEEQIIAVPSKGETGEVPGYLPAQGIGLSWSESSVVVCATTP